jgi:hypothetical protein
VPHDAERPGRLVRDYRGVPAGSLIVTGIKEKAHPNFRLVSTMNDDASAFELPEYIHSRLQPQTTYAFSVDGATFNDPGNPLFKSSYDSGGFA